MDVLVTGGAGFIGSHVCGELLRRGHGVRVLDALTTGRREALPTGVDLRVGDITDPRACADACRGTDAVVHLAAISKVAPTLADPAMMDACNRVNVEGTLRVLEAARDAGVRRLVYASSSTMYGNAPPPQHEGLPPDCLNPYALTKFVGEQYCLFFDRFYGLPAVALRYFQVCGPGQQEDGPFACVTGIFARQRAAGEPITLHGDGTQSRDFVHVHDVAQATVRALESPVRGVALNVGTGTAHSIRELADRLSPLQVTAAGRRRADADHTRADTRLCTEMLGWSARIGFDEIVAGMLGAPAPGAANPADGARGVADGAAVSLAS